LPAQPAELPPGICTKRLTAARRSASKSSRRVTLDLSSHFELANDANFVDKCTCCIGLAFVPETSRRPEWASSL
jgi:hypothetical protein